MYRRWFEKFRSGDSTHKDDPRTGRLSEFDEDMLKAVGDNMESFHKSPRTWPRSKFNSHDNSETILNDKINW